MKCFCFKCKFSIVTFDFLYFCGFFLLRPDHTYTSARLAKEGREEVKRDGSRSHVGTRTPSRAEEGRGATGQRGSGSRLSLWFWVGVASSVTLLDG